MSRGTSLPWRALWHRRTILVSRKLCLGLRTQQVCPLTFCCYSRVLNSCLSPPWRQGDGMEGGRRPEVMRTSCALIGWIANHIQPIRRELPTHPCISLIMSVFVGQALLLVWPVAPGFSSQKLWSSCNHVFCFSCESITLGM